MYIAKNTNEYKINFKSQKEIALKLGFNPCSLNSIIRGKRGTKKITAIAILKEFNKNAKLEDYFIVVNKDI